MRFAPTDDQAAFRDAARDLFAKQSDPAHVRWWWDGGPERLADSPVWRSLVDMGVLAALVPDGAGGMGLGLVDVVGVLEEAGAAALPEPLVDTAVVGLPLLAAVAAGGPGLPDDGARVAADAVAEVVADGASVAVGLTGPLVVSPERAAVAVLAEPAGSATTRLVLVRAAALRCEAQPSVDGARHLARVAWDDADATELASGDRAAALVADAADAGAVGAAAVLVGLADRMLAMTVEYVSERRQFGVPIGSFQAVKHHLADAALALEFAKPLVRSAAAVRSGVAVDPEHPLAGEPAVAASMAKAAASDAARRVAAQALQCHGAIGYTTEHDLHLYLKRTWALAEAWGSAAWHRERIARRLLDR